MCLFRFALCVSVWYTQGVFSALCQNENTRSFMLPEFAFNASILAYLINADTYPNIQNINLVFPGPVLIVCRRA